MNSYINWKLKKEIINIFYLSLSWSAFRLDLRRCSKRQIWSWRINRMRLISMFINSYLLLKKLCVVGSASQISFYKFPSEFDQVEWWHVREVVKKKNVISLAKLAKNPPSMRGRIIKKKDNWPLIRGVLRKVVNQHNHKIKKRLRWKTFSNELNCF